MRFKDISYNSLICLSFLSIGLLGCRSNGRSLDTVEVVDLDKYAGTWYEIARLPNTFEDGLKCVTATYELKDNGKIRVINRGHKVTSPDKVKEAKGTAWVPDAALPGQLKVSFFWPFAGDYYIIVLAEDYTYALVGDPSRKFLWILARSRQLDADTVAMLKAEAAERGFDVASMITVDHD